MSFILLSFLFTGKSQWQLICVALKFSVQIVNPTKRNHSQPATNKAITLQKPPKQWLLQYLFFNRFPTQYLAVACTSDKALQYSVLWEI